MMTIKLPSLVCAKTSLFYHSKTKSRVQTENGPISRRSQSVVSMVVRIYQKGKCRQLRV